MIIELGKKQFVFGMQWTSTAKDNPGREAQDRAREAKSAFLWFSDNGHSFGLLPIADRSKKLAAPLYSGAVTLAAAYNAYPNIFAVYLLNSGKYLVVGIEKGKPRRDFDCIKTSELEVASLRKMFVESCGKAQIAFIGNTAQPGEEQQKLEDIADFANDFCKLKKPAFSIPKSYYSAIVLAAVGIVGIGGWYQYKAYKDAEIRRKAVEAQKKIQERYEAEVKRRRAEETLALPAVGEFLAWAKDWPFDIGGWYLENMRCSLVAPMKCTAAYVKSSYRTATFESFFAAQGKRFVSVTLDKGGEKLTASLVLPTFKTTPVGNAMDAAKSSDEAINETGSLLQRIGGGKMPFADDKGQVQMDFDDFAVPPGIQRTQLVKPPMKYNNYRLNVPGRDLPLFSNLAGYNTINKIDLDISRSPSAESRKSFFMITVYGYVFAKP